MKVDKKEQKGSTTPNNLKSSKSNQELPSSKESSKSSDR